MKHHPLTACMVAWGPIASPALSQVEVDLAGETELARLIDLAASRRGVSVEYQPQELKGSLTLRLSEPLTDQELWRLTEDALAARGFALAPIADGAVLSVVRLTDAPKRVSPELGVGTGTGSFVSAVVDLEHADPPAVLKAIQPLLTQGSSAAVQLGDRPSILVSDTRRRVQLVMKLIAEMDQPGAVVSMVEYDAQELDAESLASLAAQVAASQEAAGGRALPGQVVARPSGTSVLVVAPQAEHERWLRVLAQLDRQQPVVTRTYLPGRYGLGDVAGLIQEVIAGDDERFRVVQDALTNALVITATPSQHAEVDALLERLASAPAEARRPARRFVLRNRDVTEVLEILRELIGAGGADAPGDGETLSTNAASLQPPPQLNTPPDTTGITQRTPAPETPASQRPTSSSAASEDGAVQLVADPATNTIIAIAEPLVLDRLESIIETLDVRQTQVALEVLIVSLTDDETLDLGIEIDRLIDGPDESVGRLSSLFGLGSNLADDALPAGGAGFTGAILSPGDFTVVIRALETLNDGRSLSRPKVLVENNEQAVLDSVIQQPFTSTNASDTVATTSFGGTQDAGTQVTVTPQIAEGDHLRLEYAIALSSFVGDSADPNIPPPRQENRVQSVATIPDGYTVALGGIELTTDADAESRVPGIGAVPIIGELFKNRSKSSGRSRFYVFIRANILRDRGFEDLKYLSDAEVRDAGIDDGWPELKPRLIR